MNSFRVETHHDGASSSGWRLDVRGEFDSLTVEPFNNAIDSLIEQGGRFVVLDLAGASFFDSTALRGVVRAANRLAELGGSLTVSGLSGAAERVLEVTGLLERLRDPTPGPDA